MKSRGLAADIAVATPHASGGRVAVVEKPVEAVRSKPVEAVQSKVWWNITKSTKKQFCVDRKSSNTQLSGYHNRLLRSDSAQA